VRREGRHDRGARGGKFGLVQVPPSCAACVGRALTHHHTTRASRSPLSRPRVLPAERARHVPAHALVHAAMMLLAPPHASASAAAHAQRRGCSVQQGGSAPAPLRAAKPAPRGAACRRQRHAARAAWDASASSAATGGASGPPVVTKCVRRVHASLTRTHAHTCRALSAPAAPRAWCRLCALLSRTLVSASCSHALTSRVARTSQPA
jgi:hypothetical protein